jgi:hypothetical protein
MVLLDCDCGLAFDVQLVSSSELAHANSVNNSKRSNFTCLFKAINLLFDSSLGNLANVI